MPYCTATFMSGYFIKLSISDIRGGQIGQCMLCYVKIEQPFLIFSTRGQSSNVFPACQFVPNHIYLPLRYYSFQNCHQTKLRKFDNRKYKTIIKVVEIVISDILTSCNKTKSNNNKIKKLCFIILNLSIEFQKLQFKKKKNRNRHRKMTFVCNSHK